MVDQERWRSLGEIVYLSGGKLVGKTRLQKTVYLLQEMGIDLGYDFDYHFYGPYSEEIDDDVKWAKYFQVLKTRDEPGNHAIPYTVFEIGATAVTHSEELRDDRTKAALSTLAHHGAVVLELAATLRYLQRNGYERNAEEELRLRKQSKASPERVVEAKQLLAELRITA